MQLLVDYAGRRRAERWPGGGAAGLSLASRSGVIQRTVLMKLVIRLLRWDPYALNFCPAIPTRLEQLAGPGLVEPYLASVSGAAARVLWA